MKNELKVFLTAVVFYTRIPCPSWVGHSDERLNKSTKYFPVIGWIVGGFSALVFYVAQFLFPLHISLIFSMFVSILLTGAFHEDGFADVCDAFGGGWSKEKILAIMKDSRIGTYGVIGIVLMLGLKYALLLEIAKLGIAMVAVVLIASHSISRFTASTFILTHQYVRDDDTSKSKPIATKKLGLAERFFSAITALLPLFLFKTWLAFFLIVPVYSGKVYLGHYFKKWIGGYTGDCLGATQQVCEVVFYVSVLVLWKFI